MNPFRANNRPTDNENELLGRKADIDMLRKKVQRGYDVLLIRGQGYGKTSLLMSALNRSFRQKMAVEEQKLVTQPFEFPVELPSHRVLPFLLDKVISSFSTLDAETASQLRRTVAEERDKYTTPENQFHESISKIYEDYGYRIVFVIDNFERFSTSPEVTIEQHNLLRGLMDSQGIRFVLATNYDISKDSLPPGIKNSYLLQKFSGVKEKVVGLTERSVVRMFETVEWPGGFEDDELDDLSEQVYKLSGGVPLLVNKVAAEVYDLLVIKPYDCWGAEDWASIEAKAYETSIPTLEHWGGMLDQFMVDCLEQVCHNNGVVNDIGEAGKLVFRGLLKEHEMGGSRYAFVTPLLEQFVREKRLRVTELIPPAPSTVPHWLDFGSLKAMVSELLGTVKYGAIGGEEALLPIVEKRQEISEEHRRTLDGVFDEYRSNYPIDLPDELLESIGEFCLGELKQAVFFKEISKDNSMGDCSRAAMISYSVVLESRLNDCFYDLLTMHRELSPISGIDSRNRTIGAYLTAMARCKNILVQLCNEAGFVEYDMNWWKNVVDDLRTANTNRCDTAHPEKLTPDVVEQMNELLLSQGHQLVSKLAVGLKLGEHFCGGAKTPLSDHCYTLCGKELCFKCTKVKKGNALGGLLMDYQYAASISATRVKHAIQEGIWIQEAAENAMGRYINVKVEEYDSRSGLFLVTPVSTIRNER